MRYRFISPLIGDNDLSLLASVVLRQAHLVGGFGGHQRVTAAIEVHVVPVLLHQMMVCAPTLSAVGYQGVARNFLGLHYASHFDAMLLDD